MTLPNLTIIPAGAGSGKTYTIQQRLGKWVAEGKVAPERIVAVTFTEAAATELRERIGARLLELNRLDDALQLDQAYISTIHGFGLRVLREFAFESGTSPEPRLLNEDEENALIREALKHTEAVSEITANLSSFGYSFDFNSKKSAEEMFRGDLLTIIELLRSVGWQSYSDFYSESAVRWITSRYGWTANGARITATLQTAIENLLQVYHYSLEDEFGTSATGKRSLRNDFQNLRRALSDDTLQSDWSLWQSLRELRQSKRGAPLPQDYDDLTSIIMQAANELPRHPGPLRHANEHAKAMLTAGQEVLKHYAMAKRDAGLVDYSDMIAMTDQLLRDHADVLETLKSRIDCLVVDEFQDTNPLQFSLLWQLKEAGIPTLIVGDLKQAIMGFQGADPRLFSALEKQHPNNSYPLTQNWRSQPRLMHFINALGPGLFGEDYVCLEPKINDSEISPLEVVSFNSKAKKDQHAVRAVAVGDRLQTLLGEPGEHIVDQHTKESRKLRGGDIAILCPTHNMLAIYANVFRAQGIRVRLQAEGWLSSRVVQIAWYALTYIANPNDLHSALYLATTELGSLSLEEALNQLMSEGRVSDPLLERLDSMSDKLARCTINAVVVNILTALDLFSNISSWPDSEQSRANLLRLLAEADEFMKANPEALASGGFHGSGVQTFLSWLSTKVERKDGDIQPDPHVLDQHAIVLSTWHAAKGREWPVVAVCGLDRVNKATLPNIELAYDNFDDLTTLIKHARIEYAPKFAAPETNDQFLEHLQEKEDMECRRALYVVLTRAKNKLILEWPEYCAGGKNTHLTYWSILKDNCALSLHGVSMNVNGENFPCTVIAGAEELPEYLNLDIVPEEAWLPTIGRRAIVQADRHLNLTPDSCTPSQIEQQLVLAQQSPLIVETYGEGLELKTELSGTALGTFIHRCFEVIGVNPDYSDDLFLATGVDIDSSSKNNIRSAVAKFESWLEDFFQPVSIQREWPLLAIADEGSVVSGIADLIIETKKGFWVVDHKSDAVEEGETAFESYRSQLASYAFALAAQGQNVQGVAINWVRRGEVILMKLDSYGDA